MTQIVIIPIKKYLLKKLLNSVPFGFFRLDFYQYFFHINSPLNKIDFISVQI